MKQKSLLFLLFVAIMANAQNVNIPDANFKSKLVAADVGTPNAYTAKDINGDYMVVDVNNDGEIQESEAQAVYRLYLDASNIADLTGIQSFTNLTHLNCSYNTTLTMLDISGMTNLQNVKVQYNALASVDASGCSSLSDLRCDVNQITNLNITGVSNLNFLSCSNNQLTNLDLSSVNLSYFYASYNLFTVVDLSMQSNLLEFSFYGCANLTTVYVKNGSDQSFNGEEFGECPNLNYVCVDESEYDAAYNSVLAMTQWDDQISIEDVTFTTTCSTTGEEGNAITGTVTFDIDADGCNASDTTHSFVKVTSTHNSAATTIFTNNNGYYSFAAETGDYDVALDLTDIPYFTAAASPVINFAALDGTVITHDFCITPDGVHPDLEVTVASVWGINPGFDTDFVLVYRNKGNQVLDGIMAFGYDDALLDYVAATPAYDNSATGILAWSFTGLQPFETRQILVTLNSNSPTETPAVNIGDVFDFTFTGTTNQTEVTPDDNEVNFSITAAGSFDPNNIICLQGNSLTPDEIGNFLHYTINFENIGTGAATFVVVTDEIDVAQYDVSSLQVLHSSHAVEATLEGNTITFKFDDINLAPEGQGNVTFKIKSLESIAVGDFVMNDASIVFDFNEAIETNEAVTTFEAAASLQDFASTTVNVYPNPATDVVTINAKSNITSVQLYDVNGRLLQSNSANDVTATLNIANQPTGLYFVKIVTQNGVQSVKITKQ
ncbi:DUF7619 domain-containing protein [Flavobacterium litorale]|uniref:T9SS type A sorting domain-containing protein n=1 Tax=Flavobacterium litorale TaxID=2856519 RepID=A0ABX8V9E3_9FLAO|nr:T9SS type A sorting domain-containing protein [Flavobacterium litorale]QYJ67271.1 T9SS type A sorting domain-containing protein [Flavobacterium litorale]